MGNIIPQGGGIERMGHHDWENAFEGVVGERDRAGPAGRLRGCLTLGTKRGEEKKGHGPNIGMLDDPMVAKDSYRKKVMAGQLIKRSQL